MTAADLMLALAIAVHPELAAAIDQVCTDLACRKDAVATCYVETRCQTHHCARNGCGPYQQLGRYADDIPELEPLDIAERRRLLVEDPVIATKQWHAVMTRYRQRFGERWPWRYNGSDNAERYLENWWNIRNRLTRAAKRGEK